MLVEDIKMQGALRRLVCAMVTDPTLQQDLMQVGLLHLWRTESGNPGRSRSWYLQSCRFSLLHWLASGRSVDSLKRGNRVARIPLDGADGNGELDKLVRDGDLLDLICVRDLVSVLSRALGRREQAVLEGLADGLRLCEAASRAKLSYPTALKYRRRIARLISEMGLSLPSPKTPHHRAEESATAKTRRIHGGTARQPADAGEGRRKSQRRKHL